LQGKGGFPVSAVYVTDFDLAADLRRDGGGSMKELKVRFGRLVGAHRRRLGWTQEELATHADISVDMVSRIEAGSTGVRFGTIDKLADAMKIDPAELFSPSIPGTALERQRLTMITSRLARLSDKDLDWVENVLEAVLRSR